MEKQKKTTQIGRFVTRLVVKVAEWKVVAGLVALVVLLDEVLAPVLKPVLSVLSKVARPAQIVMGLVFLVAGLVKVWEPVLFYWEIVPYTQMLAMGKLWPAAARAALLLAPLECGLGLALLTNWRPRLVFPLATVLMVFFLGLMVQAWRLGATADCGCFGALVDRSPGEAAAEDVVMLGLLLLGWWGTRSVASLAWGGKLVAVGTALFLGVGCVRFLPERERLEDSDLLPGVELIGLNPSGLEADLRKGEYLVELMNPKCGHCIDAVPKLNMLSQRPDLPVLVALTSFPQDSPLLVEFKKRLQPLFPIGTISRTDFFRLTVNHSYPRLAYVRDGVVQAVWEYNEFPGEEQVKKIMNHREEGL